MHAEAIPAGLLGDLIKRPPEFAFEHNDCTVRAYAIASGLPYAEAHSAMRSAGRKDRKMFTFDKISDVDARIQSRSIFRDGSQTPGKRYTVAQWLRNHPIGRYVIRISGHVIPVIDGIAYDLSPVTGIPYRLKSKSRVRAMWEFVDRPNQPIATATAQPGPTVKIELPGLWIYTLEAK